MKHFLLIVIPRRISLFYWEGNALKLENYYYFFSKKNPNFGEKKLIFLTTSFSIKRYPRRIKILSLRFLLFMQLACFMSNTFMMTEWFSSPIKNETCAKNNEKILPCHSSASSGLYQRAVLFHHLWGLYINTVTAIQKDRLKFRRWQNRLTSNFGTSG